MFWTRKHFDYSFILLYRSYLFSCNIQNTSCLPFFSILKFALICTIVSPFKIPIVYLVLSDWHTCIVFSFHIANYVPVHIHFFSKSYKTPFILCLITLGLSMQSILRGNKGIFPKTDNSCNYICSCWKILYFNFL